MKNLASCFLFLFIAGQAFSQGIPVSTSVEKKNVVLEEFTGMHCPWCPDGHKRAKQIADDNPGDVVLINVHAGSYANPSTGEPDFRTNYGSALANQSNLCGYPAGAVNRHRFTGLEQTASGCTATTAMSRSKWSTAAAQVLTEDADANLGVEAEIDVQTRELTVDVQIYYTSTSSSLTNKLNVVLLQNNIEGIQNGANLNPDQILPLPNGNYNHEHMLRHMITGQWGDQIDNAVMGNTVNETYTYTIPEDIRGVPVVLGDLEIAAFLAEGNQEIITGHVIIPTYTNVPTSYNAGLTSVFLDRYPVCGYTVTPTVKIKNGGGMQLNTLYIDYSVNGSPVKTYEWTGNLDPLSSDEVILDPINYFPRTNNTIEITTRSPNNQTDENNADDMLTIDFPAAPDASNTVTMTLQADYWGSEISWKLVNSSGAVLYSGGPYSNTPNPSTSPPLPAPVTKTFNLASGDCYELKMYDGYGDGILFSGTGFTLVDDNNFVIISDYTDYQSIGTVAFGVDALEPDSSDVFPPTSIKDFDLAKSINIFPNPTTGQVRLELTSIKDFEMNVSLTNLLGQKVKEVMSKELVAVGNRSYSFDLSNFESGIYFLVVNAQGRNYSEKIVITD